jgi:hypothetical protein
MRTEGFITLAWGSAIPLCPETSVLYAVYTISHNLVKTILKSAFLFCLCLGSARFPPGFLSETLCAFLLSPSCPIPLHLIILIQGCWWVLSPTRKETSYSDRRLWCSYILFIIIDGGILVLFIYITRLASNGIFSPSNKIHREVGRAKDLSAPL